MSFRKKYNKEKRAEGLKWESFCRANWELIDQIGLPLTTIETLDRFHDLMMNGCMDFHEDPMEFVLTNLPAERLNLFAQLVDRYLAAGFHNAGVRPNYVGGTEAFFQLVRKYPEEFNDFDIRWAGEEGHDS